MSQTEPLLLSAGWLAFQISGNSSKTGSGTQESQGVGLMWCPPGNKWLLHTEPFGTLSSRAKYPGVMRHPGRDVTTSVSNSSKPSHGRGMRSQGVTTPAERARITSLPHMDFAPKSSIPLVHSGGAHCSQKGKTPILAKSLKPREVQEL